MTAANDSSKTGHRLLQAGIGLFLIALLEGIAIPALAVPRLGLSAHLAGLTQGMFLLICGLVWPRLQLGAGLSKAGAGLATFSAVIGFLGNLIAAAWGAGNSVVPLAAGAAHGSDTQELIIRGSLTASALTMLGASAIIAWGLRSFTARAEQP